MDQQLKDLQVLPGHCPVFNGNGCGVHLDKSFKILCGFKLDMYDYLGIFVSDYSLVKMLLC